MTRRRYDRHTKGFGVFFAVDPIRQSRQLFFCEKSAKRASRLDHIRILSHLSMVPVIAESSAWSAGMSPCFIPISIKKDSAI